MVASTSLLLGLEKSTASRLADGLIGEGLVRKRPSMTDGRSVVLQLTEAGLRTARAMLNNRTEVWMGVVGGVGIDSLGKLTSNLAGLLHAMNTHRQ